MVKEINGTYRCPKNEWRFAKIYTEINQGSDSNSYELKEQAKDVLTPLNLFLAAVALGIGSSFFYELPEFPYKNIVNVLLTVSVFLTFIGSLVSLRFIGKKRKNLIESLENNTFNTEEITLYELTDEGIYINYFNKTNQSDMFFLKWTDIRSVNVDQMVYKRFSYLGERGHERANYNLKKEFKQASKEFSDFTFEPKRSYPDVRSVYLTMDSGEVSQLPIPLSWEENGMVTTFLESIDYCRKEVC